MRRPRLLVHEQFTGTAYHVISRVTHRLNVFGDEEKRVLIGIMRRYERFCGVQVLTHCVMANHFHWLVEVPTRPADAEKMSDSELVARVRRCQGKTAAFVLQEQLAYALKMGQADFYASLRERLLKRMWNLSAFVQSVKQRFSVWFNKRHKRRGTLWEERFKSVAVMGPKAIAAVAAYIDLNPVRAGLVNDPADYGWSGYCEAISGSRVAVAGLKQALCQREGGLLSAEEQKEFLVWYRLWIYGRGEERGVATEGGPMKRGFGSQAVKAVQEAGGRLPAATLLRKRVRYFTDGLAVGAGTTLTALFEAQRAYFSPTRKTGPRTMRGGKWCDLKSMRDLQEPPN